MAFDIMRLFEDDEYVSPGSIGGKIKKYRKLRGWSQKELGLRCGFSASTADVRIAQYEKSKKIPREKALKDIAAALEIDESALFDADMLPHNRMYHALFDMEDFHGLHPVKKEDGYYLEFSGRTLLDQNITKLDFRDFLEKWYEMRQKYQPNSSDTPEEKAAKVKEYAIWRGEYTHIVAKETSERMRDYNLRKEKCVKISAGIYEYRGYRIANIGYHHPDHCVWWEAVNIETGCADYHAHTKKRLMEIIDNHEDI